MSTHPKSPPNPNPNLNDNFPIGLIILSETKTSQQFQLLSINQLALSFLNIPPKSPDITSSFLASARTFKQNFFNATNQFSLLDFLLSVKRCNTDDASIKSMCFTHNQVILSVKIRRKASQMYLSIDNVSDEKTRIREKLIGSIAKNFLMTINHELRNYLCALITTAGETEMLLDPKDFLILTSSAHLIQKIVKVYILFTKISFNEIKGVKLKLSDTHDFNKWFRHTHLKFHRIFLYKNIHMPPFESAKKIGAKTDFHYMKDLLFILFIYLYYKVNDNGRIGIDIDYISQSSCRISFSHDNAGHSSVIGKEVTFEDEGRMNETEVKKSVMTLEVLEYLLMNICKHINYECELYHNRSVDQPNGEVQGMKKLITLTLNDLVFDDSSCYLKEDCQIPQLQLQLNKEMDDDMNMYLEQLSNRNGTMIDFQFEKKNTYDQSKLKDGQLKHRRSMNIASTMSKSDKESYIMMGSNILSVPMEKGRENKSICAMGKEVYDKKPSANKTTTPNEHFALLNSDFDSSETFDDNSVGNHNMNQPPRLSLYSIQYLQQQSLSQSPPSHFPLNEQEPKHEQKGLVPVSQGSLSYPFPINISNAFSFSNIIVDDTTVFNEPISSKIFSLYGTDANISKILGNGTEKQSKSNGKSTNDSSITPSISLFQPALSCDCKDILVVDDERPIAHSMLKILQSQHCESDYCKDGRDCIDKIKEKAQCTCTKRFYKLILLDVYMADWGGITTCTKIAELIQSKAISPSIKVVFISGHKLKDLILPDYDFIKGFYQKPVNRLTLSTIIKEFYYEKVIDAD